MKDVRMEFRGSPEETILSDGSCIYTHVRFIVTAGGGDFHEYRNATGERMSLKFRMRGAGSEIRNMLKLGDLIPARLLWYQGDQAIIVTGGIDGCLTDII